MTQRMQQHAIRSNRESWERMIEKHEQEIEEIRALLSLNQANCTHPDTDGHPYQAGARNQERRVLTVCLDCGFRVSDLSEEILP